MRCSDLCLQIAGYPTLKLFYDGEAQDTYRGQLLTPALCQLPHQPDIAFAALQMHQRLVACMHGTSQGMRPNRHLGAVCRWKGLGFNARVPHTTKVEPFARDKCLIEVIMFPPKSNLVLAQCCAMHGW